MNDCLTRASLSDKEALGEALTADERLFLRDHVSSCPVCAAEASLWANLEQVLEEPERLTARPSYVQPQRKPAGVRLGRFLSGRAWHRPAVASVVVMAAAAAALLWSRAKTPVVVGPPQPLAASSRGASTTGAANVAGAQLALAAGETRVNQQAALAGARLAVGDVVSVADGQACVLVPPGVSVCLDGATELRIETLEAGKRRFRLLSGHAVAHLEKQPAGSSFGFETAAGAVVAKGTEFSLRTVDSTVTLRVYEGVVLNSRGDETSAYQAPTVALLSREAKASQPSDEADSRLLELARFFGDRAPALLNVSAATGSSVTLGALQLGTAPVSALVQPGDYRMEVSKVGFASIVERLTFESGLRIARDFEATVELGAAAGRAGARASSAPATASAADLLERARELRAGGRYRDSAGVYQRLLREYASSAEARVALVSLGELQLSQLGDASAALRSFDAYLRGGGALLQEASYGRIRALRRLGKVNEAQAAAAAFITTYPKSVQAATLRKELP